MSLLRRMEAVGEERSTAPGVSVHVVARDVDVYKRQVYDNGEIVPMTDERREQILAANKSMADQALRVLALSSRTYTEKPSDFSPEALEHDLVFRCV